MKTFKTAMIPTLFLLAGSALAQGQPNQAEIQRRSAEMMIPPALTSTVLGGTAAPATPAAPSEMSEADRRAQELSRNTDMMRPQGINARSGPVTAAVSPLGEDDRRMAEIIKRTDQMKPD
jgi:hypothetical protein